MKFIASILIFCYFASFLGAEKLKLDTIYFRNGDIWLGKMGRMSQEEYSFQKFDKTGKNAPHITVPKNAVKYVVYSNFQKKREKLGIKKSLIFYENRIQKRHGIQKAIHNDNRFPSEKITFLPTIPYGKKVVDELKKAKKSIDILTYLISGTKSEPIKFILSILEEKVNQGLEVRFIMSQDAGTRQPIRVTNLREGKALTQRGIKVKYSEGARVMHKKIWIIDKETVILGSSNLTQSSFLYGNNSNVLVKDQIFAEEVGNDFENLWENCHSVN